MIVQYYSDSLGLSRPNVVSLNERYIYLLEKWLITQTSNELFVIDRAHGGSTIIDLYKQFVHDEDYIKYEKDILIIHAGVCDCAPRPVPKKVRKLISLMPSLFRKKIISFLHNNRKTLLKTGFVFYNSNIQLFEKTLNIWLQDALTKFKMILVLNIAPTNESIESHSPGFKKSITAFNNSIFAVVKKIQNDKVVMIDIFRLFSDTSIEIDDVILKEDGHHLTSLGNKMIFEKLQINSKRIFENLNERLVESA